MPSGPKKRKKAAAAAAAAAKKKEEEEMGIISHPPNPSLPPQQEAGEEKEEMESHSSDVSIEFLQPKEEDACGISADVVEDACVCERPTEILLEKGSVEASAAHWAEEEDEAEASEAAGENSVVERSTEIVLPKVLSEEESVEGSEVPVSVPADSALSEDEEAGGLPNMGTIIETSVQAPPPLLEHRAAIWNCCGLLDVFKSPER